MRQAATVLALGLALAGCKDEKKEPAPNAAAPTDAVRGAVLQAIAAGPGLPKTVQFRGVQAYTQAAPQRFAVCGLVSAFADDPTIFVPFVSVATQLGAPDATPRRFEFDTRIGTSTAEASRVYAALVADCWAGGGPAPGRPLSLPPLPDTVPDPHAPTPPDPATPKPLPTVQGKGIAADGTVTVRQSANVHASPNGPSVRTAAQGTSLHVFSQAPGGWYQVGDTAPFGWVHESMLNH